MNIMSDNYEQEQRKRREANIKKLIRLIPSFIFLLVFVILVILSRHKQYDSSKVLGDSSSSSQQTAEGDQSGEESQESSQKTRNTAVNEVLDIPETGDAQSAEELGKDGVDMAIAEEGDGNIVITLVAWNQETSTITIRIDNNTEDDITCSGQPVQLINEVETTMSAFKNSSTSMKAIPAGTYQCITYIVSEGCFAEDTESLVFRGSLRWKEGHGTETFKYFLTITFNANKTEE